MSKKKIEGTGAETLPTDAAGVFKVLRLGMPKAMAQAVSATIEQAEVAANLADGVKETAATND